MTHTATPGRNGREASVANRYSAAAQSQEEALCCPVQYRREYLDAVPEEILDRDYGCGDPTPYVCEGETVLDLGSGAGKVCYILAQVVGPKGRVIGVDCNREMIALARRYSEEVASRIGFANVEFRYGLIQDLALDLEQLAEETRGLTIEVPQDWLNVRRLEQRLRHESPMIPDDSVDKSYAPLLAEAGLPEDRLIVKFPDFLKPGSIADVPEVTENCMTSYTTAAQRAQYMCSFSRMIVKMNGRCGVYACTLVDDDGEFDLGDTLTESLDARIRLKHHRCYSCFGCGSTCSEGTPA